VLASVLLFSTPAFAAAGRIHDDPPPEIVHTSAGTTEVGTLDRTPYRIDIPSNWNHALVVYYHGYTEAPSSFTVSMPLVNHVQPIFDRGYAVIQSAYSTSGWALAEAYPETEQLRLYFLKHYGLPAEGKAARTMETIVAGGSMGGALVTAALELNPKPYSGGLDLCGSVGPTDLAFQRRFAWRAAFDFYFPGVMPPLVPTPVNFEESRALRRRVEDALRANPAAATAMRNLTGLHTDREVADDMVYFTFNIADMQHRAGGNPFDNRNFLYTGSSPTSSAADNALNDGVRRYAADPHARDYLLHHYTPTGRLYRPMLALHTTYDPRIPPWTLSFYAEQVAEAGFSDNLVQQFVKRDGHCTFSQDEIGRAFDELVTWIHTGRRPIPGTLPMPPASAPPRSATASTAIPH
jgi:pimeloyl-ACP methyl ester carboxylesterase